MSGTRANKFEVSILISACSEELSEIREEMKRVQAKIEKLEKESRIAKIFHSGEIKRKKEKLQSSYNILEQKEEIVIKERNYYQRYGTNIPEGEEGLIMRKLLQSRQEKLDIIAMIDCGLI